MRGELDVERSEEEGMISDWDIAGIPHDIPLKDAVRVCFEAHKQRKADLAQLRIDLEKTLRHVGPLPSEGSI